MKKKKKYKKKKKCLNRLSNNKYSKNSFYNIKNKPKRKHY